MTRSSLVLMTLLILLFVWSVPAEAHVLKIDGSIGVTAHINPDDAPVAGEESAIIIDVQDKSGRLAASAGSCQCTATIRQQDKVVYETDLVLTGSMTSIPYTFPASGGYSLEVAGTPRSNVGFQPFRVVFTYYVRSEFGTTATSSIRNENRLRTYAPFVVIGASLFILILFFLPTYDKKKTV